MFEHVLRENAVEAPINEWKAASEIHQMMHVEVVVPVYIHPIGRVEPAGTAAQVQIARSRRVISAGEYSTVSARKRISNADLEKKNAGTRLIVLVRRRPPPE